MARAADAIRSRLARAADAIPCRVPGIGAVAARLPLSALQPNPTQRMFSNEEAMQDMLAIGSARDWATRMGQRHGASETEQENLWKIIDLGASAWRFDDVPFDDFRGRLPRQLQQTLTPGSLWLWLHAENEERLWELLQVSARQVDMHKLRESQESRALRILHVVALRQRREMLRTMEEHYAREDAAAAGTHEAPSRNSTGHCGQGSRG